MKITYTAVLCSKIQTTLCDVWHDTSEELNISKNTRIIGESNVSVRIHGP